MLYNIIITKITISLATTCHHTVAVLKTMVDYYTRSGTTRFRIPLYHFFFWPKGSPLEIVQCRLLGDIVKSGNTFG